LDCYPHPVMEFKKDLALEKLLKVAPISINIIDISTRELICTSSWVKDHIGYTQEEYMALSHDLFEKIIHPEDRITQLKTYAALVENPLALFKECRIRIRKKGGDYLHAIVRLSVLEIDANQKAKTLLNTAVDITELVELRQRLAEELSKMEIISFKNSHELRGPVATILGLVQLMSHESAIGIQSQEIIEMLKATVTKLDAVIGQINDHTY